MNDPHGPRFVQCSDPGACWAVGSFKNWAVSSKIGMSERRLRFRGGLLLNELAYKQLQLCLAYQGDGYREKLMYRLDSYGELILSHHDGTPISRFLGFKISFHSFRFAHALFLLRSLADPAHIAINPNREKG